MEELFIIHYAEVGLKGKNRVFFEKRLARNIKRALQGTGYAEVQRQHARILVQLGQQTQIAEIKKRLRRVMGIAHFELACRTENHMAAIKAAALQQIQGTPFETLKVETKRSDKTFPGTSPEINAEIGGYLIQESGARADMRQPDLRCWIEITQNAAYIYTEKLQGIGGLPVGVSGKVLVMLSVGIDSAVRVRQLLTRGPTAGFVQH